MYSAMLTNSIKRVLAPVLLLVVSVMVLTACQTTGSGARSAESQASPEASVAPARVINYTCDDGRSVEVTLNGPERAQLKINGATAVLTAVRSASGAKFQTADGSITFWSKGNEATIDTAAASRQTHMVCTVR